jgi:hypothetical protein
VGLQSEKSPSTSARWRCEHAGVVQLKEHALDAYGSSEISST